MSNVLIVAEVQNQTIKPATLTAITFAREAAARTGGQVHGVVIGAGIDGGSPEMAKYVATAHAVDGDAYGQPLAEMYAERSPLRKKRERCWRHVCMACDSSRQGTSSTRRSVARRRMASDVPGFAEALVLPCGRPIQAGNVIATVEVTMAGSSSRHVRLSSTPQHRPRLWAQLLRA